MGLYKNSKKKKKNETPKQTRKGEAFGLGRELPMGALASVFLSKKFLYKLFSGRKKRAQNSCLKVHKFGDGILDIVTKFGELHNILYFPH